MSDFIFNTNDDYLKLAYRHDETFLTSPGDTFIIYTVPLLYTDTDYVPMVLGYYTDDQGRTFPCKSITTDATFPTPFSNVVVAVYALRDSVLVQVFGDTSDTVARSVDVSLSIFMQSALDVT